MSKQGIIENGAIDRLTTKDVATENDSFFGDFWLSQQNTFHTLILCPNINHYDADFIIKLFQTRKHKGNIR